MQFRTKFKDTVIPEIHWTNNIAKASFTIVLYMLLPKSAGALDARLPVVDAVIVLCMRSAVTK